MSLNQASLPVDTLTPGDETPVRPTHVLYRCRRCGGDLTIAMPNPGITIREAVEHRATLRVHDCDDGAQGVADLIGSGPGRCGRSGRQRSNLAVECEPQAKAAV